VHACVMCVCLCVVRGGNVWELDADKVRVGVGVGA